ncbi:MAG: radical SAM protein [Lentisphaeraceae bacterium]|nr:radical SAM protein [Lentisphaeraceae bacterium]
MTEVSNSRKIKFRKVYIEISNSCNLKCDFCPQSSLKRPTHFMDIELFDSLVKQIQPFARLLCLHVMGEPMYHPQLEEFLNICHKYKQDVSIVTNGVLLNDSNQALLLNPAVVQANFSLQSFENNYKGMDNKSYLSKIFRFTKRAFEERPDMHINYRLWNGESFEKALELNELTISRIRDEFGISREKMNGISLLGNRLINNLFLNLSENFDWPTLDMPHRSNRGRCHALNNQMAILSDGTVVPCCFDCEGVIKLGDANKDSIVDILNSERAMNMFMGFKKQQLVEPLCQRCTYIERFN